VEDNELLRLGSQMILEKHPSFTVVGVASKENEAVEKTLLLRPDVVLMDINLTDGNGIQACNRIMKKLPATKVIMITSHTEDRVLFEAIKAGAFGYLLKPLRSDELLETVKQAQQGKGILDPSLTNRVFGEIKERLGGDEPLFAELKTKELHILAMIREGKTNKEIATALSLTDGTVRNYVSGILTKLKVENRTEAAAYAVANDLDEFLPPEWQSKVYTRTGKTGPLDPNYGKTTPLKW
jgi:DNA-binding NarL/FixJ family response regulator